MNKKLYFVFHCKADHLAQIADYAFNYQKQIPKTFYTKESEAMREAATIAGLNPGDMVHVLSTCGIKQAATPKIIDKKFNEDGELINV